MGERARAKNDSPYACRAPEPLGIEPGATVFEAHAASIEPTAHPIESIEARSDLIASIFDFDRGKIESHPNEIKSIWFSVDSITAPSGSITLSIDSILCFNKSLSVEGDSLSRSRKSFRLGSGSLGSLGRSLFLFGRSISVCGNSLLWIGASLFLSGDSIRRSRHFLQGNIPVLLRRIRISLVLQ